MGENLTASPAEKEEPLARLCYVDDSRTAAFVMRRMLEPCGYQIDYFQSAEPAVVALIQGEYDLLLTDLKVSSTGMDGDDLIRTLRQSGQPALSHLPIIVITGSTDAEVLVKVYDAGANQVMTKPVDGEALDGHIRRLLFEGREVHEGERPENEEQGSERQENEKQAAAVDAPPVAAATAAGEEQEKTIPVLQVADAITSSTATTSEARTEVPELSPISLPQVDSGKEQPASLIERAMDVESAEGRAAAAGDSSSSAAAERPMPEATPVVDEFEDYEGDVEIIIDPESPAGRKRRARVGAYRAEDEVFHEISQFTSDASPPRRGFGRIFVLLLVLAGLAFAGFKVWQVYFDRGLGVATARVESGEIYQSVVLPGHVVSQRQLEVRPLREGRLVAVGVDAGDRVQAGQLLARLDDRDLLAHQKRVLAELANAREDVSLAESTLRRLRGAHEKGAVARRFVEDAEVKLRAAQKRAGVAAEEARNAERALEALQITAPFAGSVTRRLAEVGQWVTPAMGLFVLADARQREIELQVGSSSSKDISVGQTALITSDAVPDTEWDEVVTRLDTTPEAQAAGRAVKVFVSLGDAAPDLRLGQQVDAEIHTAWNPNAIKVPLEALQLRDGQTYVAVLRGGVVRLQPVVTGMEDFSMVEIRQGLEVGQSIVLPRGQQLRDGDKVYPLASQP